MSNNNSEDPVVKHFYKCESCRKKFILLATTPGIDPYPRDPDMPRTENISLCLGCRKKLDDTVLDILKNA